MTRTAHKLAGSHLGVLTQVLRLIVIHFNCAFHALCFGALVLASVRVQEGGNVAERNSHEQRPVAARVRVANKKAGERGASPPKNVTGKIHDGGKKGEELQNSDAGVIDLGDYGVFNGKVAGKHHAAAADDDQAN